MGQGRGRGGEGLIVGRGVIFQDKSGDFSEVFCLLASLTTVGDSDLGSFTKKTLSIETCFCLCLKVFLKCDTVFKKVHDSAC